MLDVVLFLCENRETVPFNQRKNLELYKRFRPELSASEKKYSIHYLK